MVSYGHKPKANKGTHVAYISFWQRTLTWLFIHFRAYFSFTSLARYPEFVRDNSISEMLLCAYKRVHAKKW